MKLTVLVDNNSHPSLDLQTEHGLSIYFEYKNKKYLLDTGASDKYFNNAKQLGIDVAEIDALIISHGHADHIGGLSTFLENNKKAQIYLSKNIRNKQFFSTRNGQKRKISINDEVFSKHLDRYVFLTEDYALSSDIHLISTVSKQYALPKGNKNLLVKDELGERLDDFSHEISVQVNTPAGRVVFIACAHTGMLNILSATDNISLNQPLKLCFGGMHLLDSTEQTTYETRKEVEDIAHVFLTKYPLATLYTGHCSGNESIRIFKSHLKDKIQTFYTGLQLGIAE